MFQKGEERKPVKEKRYDHRLEKDLDDLQTNINLKELMLTTCRRTHSSVYASDTCSASKGPKMNTTIYG